MSLSSLQYHNGYYTGNKLRAHVLARSEIQLNAADERRNAISSLDELEAYAQTMRTGCIAAMGDIPYDPTLPLNAQTVGVVHDELFDIEKIIFQTRPSVYLTANLYIPHERRDPCGAVLFIPGHNNAGKASPGCQKVTRALASAGLIVLSIDPFGQGERLSYVDKNGELLVNPCVSDHQKAGCQVVLTGDAPVRYFMADAKRAVDYLMTRDEVDPNAIGVTGSSGGGTQTCNMMVCDSRIKAAAPGTFVSSRRSILRDGRAQDAEQIWMGNENFAFDHADVFACFAPKPCLVLVVDADFFPIEGAVETVESAKRLYSFYGAENDVNMIVDHSVHAYTPTLAAKAANFFAKVLNNEDRNVVPSVIEAIPEEELLCTKAGQVKLEYSDARFIFDENLDAVKRLSEAVTPIDAAEFIRKKTYSFRKPAPLYVREYPLQGADSEGEIVGQSYFWFTQEGLPNFGFLYRDKKTLNNTLPIKVCLFERASKEIDANEEKITEFIRAGYAVLVLDITGCGKCEPDVNSPGAFGNISILANDLFFIGDSVAALRLYDLERLPEILKFIPNVGEMSIYASDNIGIIANMYKLMHDDIEVEVVNAQSISEILTTRLYDNSNITGYTIPGIGPYALKENI